MTGNIASEDEAGRNENQWWYQEGDSTKGPLSETEMNRLLDIHIVSPDTLVWRADFGDQWKPLSQTDLSPRRVSSPPPLPTAPSPAKYPQKWQKVFDKFDSNQTESFYVWSLWGFMFGPLYYFYLRMWRKGLVLIGLTMCIALTVSFLVALLELPPLQKLVSLGFNAFCAMLATRDYYRMHRFGEKMWPSLAWFKNPWAIVALIVTPLMLASVVIAYADETKVPVASTGSALASSNSTKVEDTQGPARPSTLPALLDEAHYDASHKLEHFLFTRTHSLS